MLIIPNLHSKNNYADLYHFVDPTNQQLFEQELVILFWETAFLCIQEELNKYGKIWISTSGLGISWLHLRISRVPKYYHYIDYM